MKLSTIAISAVSGLTIALAAASVQAKPPVQAGAMGAQAFLMDANKMTLYTFDKDAKDVSNCYGDCAALWPPVLAESTAELGAGYSLVTRKDGTRQVAYKGQPLYLWVKDSKPGDMTGDGVKGVWHTARP